MYPGKAVADMKYCGWAAAICSAAIPPVGRSCNVKLVVLDLVVRQHQLQKFREDAPSILKEHLAVRCRRSENEIAAPFSLRPEVPIEDVVHRVHRLRAATESQDGRIRLCRVVAIGKDGLVVNGGSAHRLRPLAHVRPERLAQDYHQGGCGGCRGKGVRAPLLHPESPRVIKFGM